MQGAEAERAAYFAQVHLFASHMMSLWLFAFKHLQKDLQKV